MIWRRSFKLNQLWNHIFNLLGQVSNRKRAILWPLLRDASSNHWARLCVFWHTAPRPACPLYPRKRTYAVQPAMSAKGQKRTLRPVRVVHRPWRWADRVIARRRQSRVKPMTAWSRSQPPAHRTQAKWWRSLFPLVRDSLCFDGATNFGRCRCVQAWLVGLRPGSWVFGHSEWLMSRYIRSALISCPALVRTL